MAPLPSAEFSNRAFATFIALQALDVLTTLIGLHLGAGESNAFVSHLMRLGPLAGLLLSKLPCMILVTIVVVFGRGKVMRLLNPWSAAVVTWNLVMIMVQAHVFPGA